MIEITFREKEQRWSLGQEVHIELDGDTDGMYRVTELKVEPYPQHISPPLSYDWNYILERIRS